MIRKVSASHTGVERGLLSYLELVAVVAIPEECIVLITQRLLASGLRASAMASQLCK